MESVKSQDEVEIIAALLRSVSDAHGSVFNTRACRLTIEKVNKRVRTEGLSFLTKTLPRLGRAFDKAISDHTPLTASSVNFSSLRDSELPRFLGEFFSRVLSTDGRLLQHPCCTSVRVIREICYLFYKYKLPNSPESEHQVIQKFEKTENDLSTVCTQLQEIAATLQASCTVRRHLVRVDPRLNIARDAKILLSRVFSSFDPTNIQPRHGPGAVATKQQLWGKYQWSNISRNITSMYPLDAYFYASLGHVCDRPISDSGIGEEDLPARVILVPKDSRGPRLISCEPVDYQWIQQGLGNAIVDWVERHDITRYNVFFTDQGPNRRGAQLGSKNGRYATLDLNEASDRVSLELVRLLFPSNLVDYLEACRSSSTVLPDGRVIKLNKFAPMGSCLCFPILALTVWAILTAAASDADTRESILVYGDDVIVPTAQAGSAIEQLESFGLKVNRDKSCTGGFFRESCGMDAFKGVDVTPVRLRTVWSSVPSPNVYTSWISYANSFYDRGYYRVYNLIVDRLTRVYTRVPDESISQKRYPSLRWNPEHRGYFRRRYNRSLQRVEYLVYDISSRVIRKEIDGWLMLLRYFSEAAKPSSLSDNDTQCTGWERDYSPSQPFSVRSYTKRRVSMLTRRWR